MNKKNHLWTNINKILFCNYNIFMHTKMNSTKFFQPYIVRFIANQYYLYNFVRPPYNKFRVALMLKIKNIDFCCAINLPYVLFKSKIL